MAKYVVAFEKWIKDEKLGFVASHYGDYEQIAAVEIYSRFACKTMKKT